MARDPSKTLRKPSSKISKDIIITEESDLFLEVEGNRKRDLVLPQILSVEKMNYDNMTEMSFNQARSQGRSRQQTREVINQTAQSYSNETFTNLDESIEKRIMRNKEKQARMVKILKENSYGERSNSNDN